MSLGYIPVIISIILCEFIIQDIAIYIGAGVGVLSSIYMWQRKGRYKGAAYPPIHIIQHDRNVTVIDNNFLFFR